MNKKSLLISISFLVITFLSPAFGVRAANLESPNIIGNEASTTRISQKVNFDIKGTAANITIKQTYQYTGEQKDLILNVPRIRRGIIYEAKAEYGGRQAKAKAINNNGKLNNELESLYQLSGSADVVSVALPKVNKNSIISVTVQYTVELKNNNGQYKLKLPNPNVAGNDIEIDGKVYGLSLINHITSNCNIRKKTRGKTLSIEAYNIKDCSANSLTLSYKLVNKNIQADLYTQKLNKEQFFSTTLYPPQSPGNDLPVTAISVLDLDQSSRSFLPSNAFSYIANALQPDDRYLAIPTQGTKATIRQPNKKNTQQTTRAIKKNDATNLSMVKSLKQSANYLNKLDTKRSPVVLFVTNNKHYDWTKSFQVIKNNKNIMFYIVGVGVSEQKDIYKNLSRIGNAKGVYLSKTPNLQSKFSRLIKNYLTPIMDRITIQTNQNAKLASHRPQTFPVLTKNDPLVIYGKYNGRLKRVEFNGRIKTGDTTVVTIRPTQNNPGLPYRWVDETLGIMGLQQNMGFKGIAQEKKEFSNWYNVQTKEVPLGSTVQGKQKTRNIPHPYSIKNDDADSVQNSKNKSDTNNNDTSSGGLVGLIMQNEYGALDKSTRAAIREVLEFIFNMGGLLLKAFLAGWALFMAARVAKDQKEGLKSFGYVIGAVVLYFMLPWLYRIVKEVGESAGN